VSVSLSRRTLAVTALLAVAALILTVGLGAAQHANAQAPRPSDPRALATGAAFGVVDLVADAGGYATITFPDTLTGSPDVITVQILTPSGGLASLPSSVRVPASSTTGLTLRFFSHQLVRDPSGNIRLKVYTGQVKVSYLALDAA
jgi:hypothetical protein